MREGPGRLYLVAGKAEIDRRRKLLTASAIAEVLHDLHAGDVFWIGDAEARRVAYARPAEPRPRGLFWMGGELKALLDGVGEPLPFLLALPAEAVPVYYGPHLADIQSLPAEESLRARVLSAHGIAVLWTTYDAYGRRNEFQPAAPTDATFHLRRPRGEAAHVWRLFATRHEAMAHVGHSSGSDPEGIEWARTLPAADFQDLLERAALRP